MLLCTKVISARDGERLSAEIDRARSSWLTYAPYLDLFRSELRRAQAVPPAEVPDDAVTMNSRFAARDAGTGETICYTLVYPGVEWRRHLKLVDLTSLGVPAL